jgi:2',3'-cyclic-nucleotide 2'-phosphodiesterase (5'-nucleotidase family)
MFKHCLYAVAALFLIVFLAACQQLQGVGDKLGMEPPPQSRQHSNAAGSETEEAVTVTLLHMNDFHSQLDPLYAPQEPSQGSAARLKTLIDGIRSKKGAQNTLLLFGGDAFQGTMFYNTWKGSAEIMTLNKLGFDAVCMGNHEFDSGPEELVRALTGGPITIAGTQYPTEKAEFLVLSTNVDAQGVPTLEEATVKRAVIEKNGVRYGLLGVTTTTTANVSSPGEHVKFLDYVASVQQEADALQAEGVDKIFLMSHSGTDVDMQMVPLLSGVDVIVGGHDHALFGDPEAIRAMGLPQQAERVAAPYPAVLQDKDEQTVLLVSAFEKGRWLGNIDITFDGEGRVQSWEGNPVFVRGCSYHKNDNGQPVDDDCSQQAAAPDPAMQALVEQYRVPLDAVANELLGQASVDLTGRHAAGADVHSMGDLTADIIYDYSKGEKADAAVVNRGGMRADLSKGAVRYADINTVLPFDNTVMVVEMTGAELLEAMDVAVSGAGGKSYGAYPHVSRNMRIAYCASASDCDNPLMAGGTVTRLEIDGKAVKPDAHYRIATNDYLAKGGDFYTVFKIACERAEGYCNDTGALLRDVVAQYFRDNSPVQPKSEHRVVAH